MTLVTTNGAADEWYADVPRSVGKLIAWGMALMVGAMGGFGYWAFTAPLAAAVIAQGTFVATGSNKIVQHLEGGIIQQIMVTEGAQVAAGETLLVLDGTAARANQRELTQRQMRLEAKEARLLAEAAGLETLTFPDHLQAARGEPEVATILDAQSNNFDVAQQTLTNAISLHQRNIDAVAIRVRGYELQLEQINVQSTILQEDLDAKQVLLDRGLVRRSEVNALRRTIAEATGQVARLEAEIAEMSEVEQRFQTEIENARQRSQQAALDELQAVQSELGTIREQLNTATSVSDRSEIRSPVSGTIVRLHYHTAGGVIESGRAIAEILPNDEPLIIEVQIPRTEIDTINNGQMATVRLVALNQRTTPVLMGDVIYVSADSITERVSGGPDQEVYVARVSVPPDELLRVPGFTPTPGMPAEIMIQTAERTFVDYITKPIRDSMIRAFREQ